MSAVKPANQQVNNLTKGNINKQLLSLSLPLLVGVFSAVMVNTIDTWFVAQLGSEELAAMGYSFPIAMMGMSIAFGFGAAASAIIGKSIGAAKPGQAKRQAGHILLSSVLFVGLISTAGIYYIHHIVFLLGASSDTAPLIKEYLTPWFIGLVFLVTPMVGSAILRGYGNTKVQSMVMMSAAVFNAVLDPIFIFGIGDWEGLGIAGAAWATVIARAITFFITLYFLFKGSAVVTFRQINAVEVMRTNRTLFKLAASAATVSAIAPVANAFLTRLLAQFGDTAVAGLNIAMRIDALLTLPAFAVSMAIGAFVSQNAGAKQYQRLEQAWRNMGWFTLLGFGFVVSTVHFAGAFIIGLFTTDLQTHSFAQSLLTTLAISSLATILLPIYNAFNTAQGHARPGLLLSLFRYLGLLLPMTYIGMNLMDFPGILLGMLLAHVLSAGIAWQLGQNRFHKPQLDISATELKPV